MTHPAGETDPQPAEPPPAPPAAPDPTKDQPTEPLRAVALTMAAATAVTTLLVAFGVHLTHEQSAAVVGAVGALGALGVWWWGRRKVYSPATVARLLLAARVRRVVDYRKRPAP
jgi:hypothetical protein